MQVSALHVYPVKSLRGASPAEADVELAGLRHDRRWMLVDPGGKVLTARERPRMLAARADPLDPDAVVLSAAGRPSLTLRPPRGGVVVPVQLSGLARAVAAGAEADAWFAAAGLPGRLVWLDDPARRPVDPRHGGRPGDPLSLADDGPILLTTTASLARLNEWIAQDPAAASAEPLVMERFRPNIVVDGDMSPFVEDRWGRVRIGDVELRFAEHCDRCVLTTIDPSTQAKGKEPLRVLARHRRWDGKVWFGIRLVPLGSGRIRVGDQVTAR